MVHALLRVRDRAFHDRHSGNVAAVGGVAVEEREGRDDVRGLEEVPGGDGLLGTGADGDGEDVLVGQRGGTEGAEHV